MMSGLNERVAKMKTAKTETVKINPSQELEAYKAEVKLHNQKIHYRYKMGLLTVAMLVAGFIGGYFVSINVMTEMQARVTNSIEVSLKDQPAE